MSAHQLTKGSPCAATPSTSRSAGKPVFQHFPNTRTLVRSDSVSSAASARVGAEASWNLEAASTALTLSSRENGTSAE